MHFFEGHQAPLEDRINNLHEILKFFPGIDQFNNNRKVFRVGLLMHGKPPNFKTLVKWVRMA